MTFYDCVTTGANPPTDANDALRDIALCRSIIRGFAERAPVDQPSALPTSEE
jgi:hypothetical protein